MGKAIKETIVISAINFFEGGPLTILKDSLSFANAHLTEEFTVIALVHKKLLFEEENLAKIIFYEFPTSRGSYINRLYFEYFHFKKLSKEWKPFLWFSLHDMTPNVVAKVRAVYCHNPTPFKKKSISDLFFQPTIFLFSLFYKFLYRINLKENNFVVVQQKWIKSTFLKFTNLKSESILVCYPAAKEIKSVDLRYREANSNRQNNTVTFFYPALARPFKNFEIIGEAVAILEKRNSTNFKVVLTIDGTENRYASYIVKKYSKLANIIFTGLLSYDEVVNNYAKVDALLFSSTLETWGLAISEFKEFDKPILLAKLPYAYETLGEYDKGCFFDPYDANDLANKMQELIEGRLIFDEKEKVEEGVVVGWAQLFEIILKNK